MLDLWREDIERLILQHYEELTLDKDVVKLAPDWRRYYSMIENGSMVAFGITKDKQLVGYSVFFLSQHLHYENNTFANNDVLFLAPEQRVGMTGIKFIKYCEQELARLNVSKIVWHVKAAKDFRKILHRMGYADEDILVGKALR